MKKIYRNADNSVTLIVVRKEDGNFEVNLDRGTTRKPFLRVISSQCHLDSFVKCTKQLYGLKLVKY